MGHGGVLFLVGAVLCLFKSCIVSKYPSMEAIMPYRYLLTLMGFFAAYCGLIYNDFMSLPLELYDSCYSFQTGKKLSNDCVYPVGIDPIWYVSVQEIGFMNSIKMKMAVIIGVLHMTLGIILKGANCLYFNDRLSFVNEFIPQFLLMMALFGWMDYLIILKWLTDWTGRTNKAPSIVANMISMCLGGGKVVGAPLFENEHT